MKLSSKDANARNESHDGRSDDGLIPVRCDSAGPQSSSRLKAKCSQPQRSETSAADRPKSDAQEFNNTDAAVQQDSFLSFNQVER